MILSSRCWSGSALFLLVGLIAALRAEPLPVVRGEATEFEAPMSFELRRAAGKNRVSAVEGVRGLIAVPADFDPARTWPIFVVSATADPGLNSSRALARRYVDVAIAAGWVVLAADPQPAVKPEIDELRYAVVRAALARVSDAWPGAERWPIAFGGFSGGAKYSGTLAAMAARDGRMPIGIFLGGCNAPTPARGLSTHAPPRTAFRAVPIFLSSGDIDPISTPADHERVRLALRNAGFRHLRLETYSGKHVIYAPHVGVALKWFDDVRAAGN